MNYPPASVSDPTITHHFILFVAGGQPNSLEALQNLQRLCEVEIGGHYRLEVVDVFKEYQMALAHHVLVTPCVVRLLPEPRVMIAGTLGDSEKVRTVLDLVTGDRRGLS